MVITDVILPAISDITEKVILTVIILPLFLLNQIVAAIDIFAGIQDIGEVEMPTSIFSDAPVRLAGRAAPILACPHADAETDAERLWFAAWQDYIDASASVVMRRTAATNDPVRYYPHIRTFMEENDIPFGSRQMYKVIADAIVAGIPIGAGLTVNDISSRVRTPSTEEFVSKMRFLAPDEDNILNRPNHPYNSDSFVFLENLVIDLSFIEEMLNDADDSEGDPIEMSQHEYERILRLLFIDAYNRNLISPNHFENRLKYLRDNPHMDNSNELNRMTDPSYVVDFSVVRRFIGVNNTTSRTRHDDFVSIPHPRFGDIFTGQGDILNPHIWGNEYMRGLYLDYLGNIGGGWNPGSGGGWNPGSGGWNPGSGGWNPGDIGDTGEEKPQRTVSWIFLNFLDGLKDVEEKAADVSGNLQWREWVGYRDEIYRALKTLKIDLDDLREYGPYLGTPFRESLTGIRDIIIGWSHASAVRSDYEYALQTLSGVAGMMSGEFGSIVRISPIAAAEPEFYQARLEISLAALLEKYDYLQSVLENSDYWEEIIRGLSEELPENDTSPPASEEDGYDDSPLVPGNPDIDTEALEEYITAVSEWSALRPSLEYYFLLGNMELLREPDYHRRSELSALLNDIRYDFEPHRIDYNSETAIKNRPLTHGNTTYRTPYGHLVALGISDIDLVYSYVNYNTPWYNLIDVFYALQAELLELEEDEEAENRNLRLQQLHTRLFRLGVGAELIRGYDDDPSLILEAIKARYIALDSEFNSENIAGLISMRAALNAMGISEAYIFELTGVILNSDITEEMLWSQLMNYFFQGWYSNTFFMTYNISFGNAFDNLFLDDDNDNSGEYINTEAIYEAANLITLTTFYPANIIWKDYIQHNRDIVADPERAFNDPLRYHENIRFMYNSAIYKYLEDEYIARYINEEPWKWNIYAETYRPYLFQQGTNNKYWAPEDGSLIWNEEQRLLLESYLYMDRYGSDMFYAVLSSIINSGVLEIGDLSIYAMKTDYSDARVPARPSTMTEKRVVTLLEYFIQQPTVSAIFWGITLISIALCLFFAIYEIIRSMGDYELKKPVSKIMGFVGKSMLTFLIIPFFFIASLSMAGAVLTQATSALYGGANSSSQRVNLSGAIFYSAVPPEAVMVPGEKKALDNYIVVRGADPGNMQIRSVSITQAAAHPGATLQAKAALHETRRTQYLYEDRGTFADFGRAYENLQRDFDVVKLIWPGNLLIMSGIAWFVVIMMSMVMFIFIRRIFEIVLMYIISPIFTATIPLDDGKAFKAWRERFIATILTGFGSLLAFKIFILLISVIWEPSFRLADQDLLNFMMKSFLMGGGIYFVYKSNSMISALVSPEAAEAEKGTIAWVQGIANSTAAMAFEVAKEYAKQALKDATGVFRLAAKMTGTEELLKQTEKVFEKAADKVGDKVSQKIEGIGQEKPKGGGPFPGAPSIPGTSGGGGGAGAGGEAAGQAVEGAEKVAEGAEQVAEAADSVAEAGENAL